MFKIIIVTRIDRKIAPNQLNLMIFASFESRESGLSNDILLAAFERIHGKLQSN